MISLPGSLPLPPPSILLPFFFPPFLPLFLPPSLPFLPLFPSLLSSSLYNLLCAINLKQINQTYVFAKCKHCIFIICIFNASWEVQVAETFIFVSKYLYMFLFVYSSKPTRLSICISMHLCIYYLQICLSKNISIYLYIYISMYLCM